MVLNDYLTLVAVLLSPIIAVVITLWWTKRDSKKIQKMNLFMTLLANRKAFPIPVEYVNALNTIDVVFHDKPKVIQAWKNLYNAYNTTTENINFQVVDHRLMDLLDEMGKSLGYKNIRQTDFDSYYSPQLYQDEILYQQGLNTELLRVLKNSQSFGIPIQSNQNNEMQRPQ